MLISFLHFSVKTWNEQFGCSSLPREVTAVLKLRAGIDLISGLKNNTGAL